MEIKDDDEGRRRSSIPITAMLVHCVPVRNRKRRIFKLNINERERRGKINICARENARKKERQIKREKKSTEPIKSKLTHYYNLAG